MSEEILHENIVVKGGRPGILAIGAFAILVVSAIGIIFQNEYSAGTAEPASQVASVADSQAHTITDISLNARAAIMVDITDDKILYALNPDVQLPLASLTKVPLALAVSEVLPSDTIITIPYDTAPQGSAERLTRGSRWRLQDVIDFTLVASSNEGAKILANAADDAVRAAYRSAPEHAATIWRMNSLAQQLGLNRTYFLNASGLDISPTLSGAYGSARDMAALFAYAASQHLYVFSKTAGDGVVLTSVDGRSTARAFNTNEVQGQIPGLIMGKTGITDLAGGNLAVVFNAGESHTVVAVVLGSTREGRFSDMRQLVAKAREADSAQNDNLAIGSK